MDVFDLRETLIPFSLLQVTNAFKAIGPGEVMEIVAGDVGIATDLANAFCRPTSTNSLSPTSPWTTTGRSLSGCG